MNEKDIKEFGELLANADIDKWPIEDQLETVLIYNDFMNKMKPLIVKNEFLNKDIPNNKIPNRWMIKL